MAIPSQEQVSLLTDYDAGSVYTAAYHELYANIRFNWDTQKQQHTVLITTPAFYAGHAAAAANIGIAAAQNGVPTIVVDADVQHPSLQQRFGIGETLGLSDLLASDTITADRIAAQLCPTFVRGLRLLCAGKTPLAPTTLLAEGKIEELLSGLRSYLAETEATSSLIIVNGPSVIGGTHAAQLSNLLDQTLLVIVTGRTTRKQAKQAQEQLVRAHANLAGVIMLDV